MPSVQIKDVPEETHAVLRQRAAAAHQSLQEYLRARLIQEASEPTLDEVLDRAGGRAGGSVPLTTGRTASMLAPGCAASIWRRPNCSILRSPQSCGGRCGPA